MSVNYHAFQSRNVIFPDAGAVCEQWRTAFSGYDPERIAAILDLRSDDAHLYLTYFGRSYRLCLENGILEKQEENAVGVSQETSSHASVGTVFLSSGDPAADRSPRWTERLYFNEAMALYHLLRYTKDHPQQSGIWVPNTELHGTAIRSRQPDPLLTPFSRLFSGRCRELQKACEAAGGSPAGQKGDADFLFHATAQIPLRLIFWDADEDFPSQTQVLVDSRITDFLHVESVGCVVSDLLEIIKQKTGEML
jgi:hypothetical protein